MPNSDYPSMEYRRPSFWIAFLEEQIENFGPDNQHPSYGNPGKALLLVQRWKGLMEDDMADLGARLILREDMFEMWKEQAVPEHTFWNELLRGYERWAMLEPKFKSEATQDP
jgi:hypothetical protein